MELAPDSAHFRHLLLLLLPLRCEVTPNSALLQRLLARHLPLLQRMELIAGSSKRRLSSATASTSFSLLLVPAVATVVVVNSSDSGFELAGPIAATVSSADVVDAATADGGLPADSGIGPSADLVAIIMVVLESVASRAERSACNGVVTSVTD